MQLKSWKRIPEKSLSPNRKNNMALFHLHDIQRDAFRNDVGKCCGK